MMKMTGALHQGRHLQSIQNTTSFYSGECMNDSNGKKEDNCELTGQELTLSSLSLDTASTMATTADCGQTQQYYPSYYIQVIEEPVEFYDSKDLARKVVDSTNSCSGSSSEAYEKTTTKHGDKMFYKFHKRLGRCPEQVLRYANCCGPDLIY